MGAAAPVLAMGQAQYTEEICGVLGQTVAGMRSPAKVLADIANTNVRTAENWLQRKCAPSGLPLLRLMAQIPALQATVRRLTAMESDLDPRFEQQLNETFLIFQQMKRREGK